MVPARCERTSSYPLAIRADQPWPVCDGGCMQERSIVIRAAAPHEFDVAAEFWMSMRRELNMPDEDLAPDWKALSVRYFERRHAAGELRWFFATDGERPVASAAGFLLDGYPTEICINRRVGYIAGVFVLP